MGTLAQKIRRLPLQSIAALSPSCASEITSLTQRRPRRPRACAGARSKRSRPRSAASERRNFLQGSLGYPAWRVRGGATLVPRPSAAPLDIRPKKFAPLGTAPQLPGCRPFDRRTNQFAGPRSGEAVSEFFTPDDSKKSAFLSKSFTV